MSPTATIASIIVALVFFAWLFQTDTKDPGYEAYVKRQQEERKAEQAQKASMGISVTDAGVTKDDRPLEFGHRDETKGQSIDVSQGGGLVIVGDNGNSGVTLTSTQGKNDPTTRPQEYNPKSGFASTARLNGTFIGVGYVGDAPGEQTGSDVPSITFRWNGTFATQNMAAADVDMEPAAAGVATLDRGSGKYKLAGNTLDLTYTDGLTRKKGQKRTYVVVPVGGPDDAPTAITIQGKIFKLDNER